MANYNYVPSEQVKLQQRMAEELMNTPMRQGLRGGQPTDWGRGLAHMLRQWQGGKQLREAKEQAKYNEEALGRDSEAYQSAITQGDSPLSPMAGVEQAQFETRPYRDKMSEYNAGLAKDEKAAAAKYKEQLLRSSNKRQPTPEVITVTYLDPVDNEQKTRQEFLWPGGEITPYGVMHPKYSPQGGGQPQPETYKPSDQPANPQAQALRQVQDQTPNVGQQPNPVAAALNSVPQQPAPQPPNPAQTQYTPTPPSAELPPYKDQKRAGVIKKQKAASERLTAITTDMLNNFLAIEGEGANVNYKNTPVRNFANFMRAELPVFDKMAGTKVNRFRQQINANRPTLLNFLRQATEQGARGLDSNRELDFYLQAATVDSADIHPNVAALYKLNRLLGTGEEMDIHPQWQEYLDRLDDEFNKKRDFDTNKMQGIADKLGLTLKEVREEMAERRTNRINDELSEYGQ
jgi:hypothetical protein